MDCDFSQKDEDFRFTVKVPVYDEGYELVCAIYDFNTRKKTFRVRRKFSTKDLLHGSEELTEHLQPATSKQLTAHGSLTIRWIGATAVPFCACRLVACTLQGHVDHAFVWVRGDTATTPSRRLGQEVVLETALVQFNYAPQSSDEDWFDLS